MQVGPTGRGPRAELAGRWDGVVERRLSVVRHFALFANISPPDCASVVSAAQERQFSRRQTIFAEAEPANQIWLLTSGCAKVTQFTQSGGEVILRLNGPGELMGMFGGSSEGTYPSTASAVKVSTTLVWDAPVFEAMLERSSALRRNLARILSERLREMEERFREISTERVASRLSSQLVRLHGTIGSHQLDGVELTLSQHELAQLIGTTLFTVSRQLAQWEQRGILRTRREAVLICDLPALMDLSANE
jgi:CRP-like cAMP-binding protein